MRNDFPILKKIIYLDSGAGTLKPKQVINAITNFYLNYPLNPHSIDSKLGTILMSKILETRKLVASLIDINIEEVIFTSGTTDSLNKIALMLKQIISKDDQILISKYNHVSNIFPWIEVAKETGAKIIISDNLEKDINNRTKIICYSQMNNSLENKLNYQKIYKLAKENNAFVINDAAQAIAHEKVSSKWSDVIAFSGNKIYGPTGIGVLYINKILLKKLKPVTFGGGASILTNDNKWISKDGYYGFEPGTLNTAGIIGLGEAIKYFNKLDLSNEKEIAIYAYKKLSEIDGIKIYSTKGDLNILFNIKNINSQDIASYLGNRNIIVRSGDHCAKLVKDIINENFSVRVSIASYNIKKDIDTLVETLKEGGDFIEI